VLIGVVRLHGPPAQGRGFMDPDIFFLAHMRAGVAEPAPGFSRLTGCSSQVEASVLRATRPSRAHESHRSPSFPCIGCLTLTRSQVKALCTGVRRGRGRPPSGSGRESSWPEHAAPEHGTIPSRHTPGGETGRFNDKGCTAGDPATRHAKKRIGTAPTAPRSRRRAAAPPRFPGDTPARYTPAWCHSPGVRSPGVEPAGSPGGHHERSLQSAMVGLRTAAAASTGSPVRQH